METITHTKDIVKLFAQAVKDKNIELISSLLSDKGEFATQNSELEALKSDKATFMNWLSEKLENNIIESIEYDQCSHCKIGNPVVLFNGGSFPREIQDYSEKSKTGMMCEIKDGIIESISFCYVFLHSENRFAFEVTGEILKKEMQNGLTFEEAYEKVMGSKERKKK